MHSYRFYLPDIALHLVLSLFCLPAISQIQVLLPDIVANPNTSISIPVTVGNLTGANVIAFQTIITFDENVVNATGHTNLNTLTSNWTVFSNVQNDGEISIGGFGTNALSGSGELIRINFTVTGQPGDMTDLIFSTFIFNNGTPVANITDGKITIPLADCEGVPGGTALPGTACDDMNAQTVNDTWDAACNCTGTFDPCSGQGDNDNDGYCSNVDCNDNDPNLSRPGNPCDDGNPNTTNDTVSPNCTCEGIVSSYTFSPYVLAAAGSFDRPNNQSFSLSWTLGEPVIETIRQGVYILKQGFQQSEEFLVGVMEIPGKTISFQAYPNPSSSIIHVEFPESFDHFLIVHSLQGVILHTQISDKKQDWLDLEGLPAGTYIISIQDKDSGGTTTFKVQKL